MPEIAYEKWNPKPEAVRIVRTARDIAADYAQQGYDLTLRQLYYQFVARGHLPNTEQSYNRLGSIINKARLAGVLDWEQIVDRTRNLEATQHWGEPQEVIETASNAFRLDKWARQPRRVEVWVEKEALAGVVEQVARRHDVAYFACRGYVSQSEMWVAAQRIMGYISAGQAVTILHLGDHDPSGIDMTRDIIDRLDLFTRRDWINAHLDDMPESITVGYVENAMAEHCGLSGPGSGTALTVDRIALNWDQIEEYDPPPNPAKMTDSRAKDYVENYGDESWELDALDPSVLDDLIESNVVALRDETLWDEAVAEEDGHRASLRLAAQEWARVVVPALTLTPPDVE